MGNLTRDPEMRYTPKGTAVAQVTLAINRTWKDEGGTKHEDVTFVDCSVFSRTAEIVAQYCKKGDPLFVEGRLKMDQWEDKTTGKKRSALKVIGESIQLLGSRRTEGGEADASETRQERPAAKAVPTTAPEGQPVDDDDVPF